MKQEIETSSDADVLGRDADEWTAYLVAKWGMTRSSWTPRASEQLVEVEREHVQRGYDIFSRNRGPGTRLKTTDVRLELPAIPSETLQVIAQQHLATNPFSLVSAYPPFAYDHRRGVISVIASSLQSRQSSANAKMFWKRFAATTTTLLSGIQNFPAEVARAVAAKRERVGAKHKGLDDLAAKVGIKLIKKADVASAVTTAVQVRSKIAPVMPPLASSRNVRSSTTRRSARLWTC